MLWYLSSISIKFRKYCLLLCYIQIYRFSDVRTNQIQQSFQNIFERKVFYTVGFFVILKFYYKSITEIVGCPTLAISVRGFILPERHLLGHCLVCVYFYLCYSAYLLLGFWCFQVLGPSSFIQYLPILAGLFVL